MSKQRKGSRSTLLAVALLVLGVLLGACGTDKPTGAVVQTAPGFVSTGTQTAGMNACIVCHSTVKAAWEQTRHANLNSSPSFTTGTCKNCHDKTGDSQYFSPVRMVVGCEGCHGLGGGPDGHVSKGGMAPIGNAAYPAGVVSGTVATTATVAVSAQFATCTGCHQLLNPMNPLSAPTSSSAVHDASGSYPLVVTQGVSSNINIITDTHYAQTPYSGTGSLQAAFGTAGAFAVRGYSMDYVNDAGALMKDFSKTTTCTDCHNPHGTADINREWAQSAHADRYGAPSRYWNAAWARTNWTYSSSNVVCQRCHTTTGMANIADALRSGDLQRADDIRHGLIVSIPKTTLWKPEMLKCNGCHTDNKGTLRNPGAVTADYDYISSGFYYAKASFDYPDISNSNVCLLCHSARESGDTLKALNDPTLLSAGTISFFDFSAMSQITSHYLTGGGTVFRATGYTFAGRNYANPTSYIHDKIGTNTVPNSGTSGPCAGCHMSRPNKSGNHLFMPVVRETLVPATAVSKASATITGIASQVCWNCHDKNEALLLEQIKDQKLQFEESVVALQKVLETRGYYFNSGFKVVVSTGTATLTSATTVDVPVTAPTISGTRDVFKFAVDDAFTSFKIVSATSITIPTYTGSVAIGTAAPYVIINNDRTSGALKQWLTQSGQAPFTVPDTQTDGSVSGKNNMGAAFNFYLLESEPAAYVHNRYYTKRLLYDSIDWVDDNNLNFSTGVTLNNLCVAGTSSACEAMKYLLVGGQVNPYSSAERP